MGRGGACLRAAASQGHPPALLPPLPGVPPAGMPLPLQVPHLVNVETDRMFYLRSMKAHYEQQCRPPLVLHHAPMPLSDVAAPRQTAFAQANLREHVLGVGLDGSGAAQQRPQPPRKYFLERRVQRRAKLLTEAGLFSADAVRAHQQDLLPKAYAKRTSARL